MKKGISYISILCTSRKCFRFLWRVVVTFMGVSKTFWMYTVTTTFPGKSLKKKFLNLAHNSMQIRTYTHTHNLCALCIFVIGCHWKVWLIILSKKRKMPYHVIDWRILFKNFSFICNCLRVLFAWISTVRHVTSNR